jgi:dephospho-CoA kinase
MLIIGVTGSIGMGKSATARLFREAGIAVYDADAAVHTLYAGAAVAPIARAFPDVVRDNAVDRHLLSQRVLSDSQALRQLESIVHPLVFAAREEFLAEARAASSRIVALDIPLLFETGGERTVDIIVVVSADPAIQRARVLSRPGMTPERFASMLSQQLPDSHKRQRAHFVVNTDRDMAFSRRQVQDILRAVAGRAAC